MKVWYRTLDLPSTFPTNHSSSLRSLPRLAYLPKIAMEPVPPRSTRASCTSLQWNTLPPERSCYAWVYICACLSKSRSSSESWRERKRKREGLLPLSFSFLFFRSVFFSLTSYIKSIIDSWYLFFHERCKTLNLHFLYSIAYFRFHSRCLNNIVLCHAHNVITNNPLFLLTSVLKVWHTKNMSNKT